MEPMEEAEGEKQLDGLRACFNSGKTKCGNWRKSQLKGLLALITEKEADIFKALYQDLGKPKVEAFRDEVGVLRKSVNLALECLKQWMASKKIQIPLAAFPTTGEIVPEPLGVILIFSSWNYPIGLALEPLIGAIAAGNTVVLKPSELAPSCSSLLAQTIPIYLDNEAIKVVLRELEIGIIRVSWLCEVLLLDFAQPYHLCLYVQGGSETAQQLLDKKWDKIFFTGSPRVGRIVLSAAAKHLTPVTLELGGKCPAVIDSLSSSWDRKVTIKRILVGKYGACGGQACLGIDYILVDEKFAPILIELLKSNINKMFGENPGETNSVSRIINKQHFLRLEKLLNEPSVRASIIHGGSSDEEKLFIQPTILLDPPLKTEIMTEEIFGPLLPIITLKKIEDSIEFINSRPKPLAAYVFTNNETLKRRMISETSSGSLTFNDVIIQYTLDTMPFGGVGESGFGRYHGKFSFDTFSHEKGILRRSFLTEVWFRFPPWNAHKLQLLRDVYEFDYLGILLTLLGFKR